MKKVILAVAIIFSPLLYSTAFACVCPTIGGTSEQLKAARLEDFKSAATVFTGEVIELEENKVKLKVEKIWKGKSVDEIVMVIQLKRDEGSFVRTSCDYHYELGNKYLIYAYDNRGDLTTYQCSRTTSFKHTEIVEQKVKGLGEIKSPELRNIKPKH